MRSHDFTLEFVGVSLSALMLCACDHAEAPKAAAAPEVLVTPAVARDVPVYRDWVGTLDGSENAEIRARVTGYLLRRDYKEGSLVKEGDLLFEIDPRPFEAALEEARSALKQGKAVQLASQSEADRNRQLFTKKVISETEFVNKTQLNESNVAKVSALMANLEQAQLNLGFCKITSPVDGIAGIAKAQVGDLVGTSNSTVLTYVSTLDPIKVIMPVSEGEFLAANSRVQQMLKLPVDKRPERIEIILADGSVFPQKARLLAVDRQVAATTGTILVTALLENPGSVLRPGFFARARIEADTLKGAVVVPQRAVQEVQGSYQLGIVDGGGNAEIRPVKVGPRTGCDWVITSGLEPGERVIVEGLQKVRAGAPVAAKPWSAPPSPASSPGPLSESTVQTK